MVEGVSGKIGFIYFFDLDNISPLVALKNVDIC